MGIKGIRDFFSFLLKNMIKYFLCVRDIEVIYNIDNLLYVFVDVRSRIEAFRG